MDGARGELSYRGHEIGALVGRPFAEVAALVATGSFDADFGRRLTDHGTLSPREEALVLALPDAVHPMHVLQGLTPVLDPSDAFADQGDAAQNLVDLREAPGRRPSPGVSSVFHTHISVVVHARMRWTRNAGDMAGTPPCAARALGAK